MILVDSHYLHSDTIIFVGNLDLDSVSKVFTSKLSSTHIMNPDIG